jgi:hypothetical protein
MNAPRLSAIWDISSNVCIDTLKHHCEPAVVSSGMNGVK